MVRDEENRKLAEWLEPMPTLEAYAAGDYSDVWQFEAEDWDHNGRVLRGTFTATDFYTDEAANAMLLEKMPMPYLWLQRVETQAAPMWHCLADYEHIKFDRAERNNDRKTAIVKAGLAYLEAQEKK